MWRIVRNYNGHICMYLTLSLRNNKFTILISITFLPLILPSSVRVLSILPQRSSLSNDLTVPFSHISRSVQIDL